MSKRRYSYYNEFYYTPTRPLEAKDGIKARSQHGSFTRNWWATRWIEALEQLMDSKRLTRGRNYARRGQVLSIKETRGGIEAQVQGSRPKPYKITIQVAPLTEAQWEKVIDALSEQAIFTAQLLAGEMPQDIEEAFRSAGVSLFPTNRDDLKTHCSCPDWANPCKHVAATHFILGERFDEDPFLLFRLRGQSQEQILQALRQRRAGQMSDEKEEEETEVVIPLEDDLESFWQIRKPLDRFLVAIRSPSIEMPLLKRLGDPTFVPEPGLQYLLRPVLQAISQTALEVAYQDTGEEGNEKNDG